MFLFKSKSKEKPVKRSITREQYILDAEYEANARKRLMASMDKEDSKFSNPGDVSLTDEQRQEVEQFWKKYDFITKPPYAAVQTNYNRTGVFDPKCVSYIFRKMNKDAMNPPNYRIAWQDKAYLPRILPDAAQPRTLVRKVEGFYLDTDFRNITAEEAAKICTDYIADGNELVWKGNNSGGGGKTVKFIDDISYEDMLKSMKQFKSGLTIQEPIVQHQLMNSLNASTVNTLRLITVKLKGKIVPTAALIKVGGPNTRVDNYVQGGCLIGVDVETGMLNKWALDKQHNRISTLPSGVDLSQGIQVPMYDKIVESAVSWHASIPKPATIGWDIAIGPEGPILVEENFSCDIRINQAVSGGVFGKYTEEFLDIYYLEKFFKRGFENDFGFQEYCDHIVIERYYGSNEAVIIPGSIKDKPVTKLGKDCFKSRKKVKAVTLPETVTRIGTRKVLEKHRGVELAVEDRKVILL